MIKVSKEGRKERKIKEGKGKKERRKDKRKEGKERKKEGKKPCAGLKCVTIIKVHTAEKVHVFPLHVLKIKPLPAWMSNVFHKKSNNHHGFYAKIVAN